MHGVGSRNKLTPSHRRLYPGATRLDEVGRTICAVGCLPRKELHEAWEMAERVRARFRGGRVGVLPCCHTTRSRTDLLGWPDPAFAMDLERAARLRSLGYSVWTEAIPEEVSPKNRLLLGAPAGFGCQGVPDFGGPEGPLAKSARLPARTASSPGPIVC